MLPQTFGEYGIVADPEFKFSEKGNGWLKLRCKAADRTRDAQGQWTDGKTLFIDVLCFGKAAENLFESVAKGDSVVVTGKLEQNEWTDQEGNKRTAYRILADSIGVSVRWQSTKGAPVRTMTPAEVASSFETQPTEAPF